ncbi:MAG: response regulator [Desulfobacteraceae bacterium]|nr:response regulator [Desulfobacteraceae bacterium]
MKNTNNPCVLIVDDNPFNREMLRTFLEPEGFLSVECRNGKEALERLKEAEFQLIFMDLLMPGMDGFETIQRVRSMGVNTPIIIVSSMSSREDRQRCLEAGGNDFLPKPINIKTIKELAKKYHTQRNIHMNETASHAKASEAEPLHFSGYHILLVEEDDNVADRHCRFLKNLSFEVTRVSNGDQAWELFLEHKHKFNIIISNIFTSGTDGLGVLARIKRDYSKILVFIYSREYDTDTYQLAIKLGADGIMKQSEFESSITGLIESGIYQGDSRMRAASTASQVRKAQAQLIRYGCVGSCSNIDIAYSQLTDAGGDIACCRRFNMAGRCGIILGDVAGHNVMSSYVSAFSLGILASNWNRNQNPLDLIKTINAELNKSDYDKFHLCATAMLWDMRRKKIKISSAGNPGGLIVTVSQKDEPLRFRELDGGGMCLGLLKEENLFLSYETELDENSFLFVFSDGIDISHIMAVLSSRSVDLNRDNIKGLSQEIMDRILEKQVQNDDMILITLKHTEDFRAKGLHYEMSSTYEEVDKACKWAEEQCTPERIPQGNDLCYIMIALREALINAVKHGNNFDPAAFVDLSLYFEPGILKIDVSDEGPGFEISDNLKKIEDVCAVQSGARGLPAMNSTADSISVYGGTVSLVFKETET